MKFETKLRKWQLDDAAMLVELCKDHAIRSQWNYHCPYPYSIKKAEFCIQFFRHANPLRYRIFAISYHHELCGWIQCVMAANQCAKLSYFLADEYTRTGALKEAVSQMCTYCFDEWNVLSVYAKAAIEQRDMQNILLANDFVELRDTAPIYIYFRHCFHESHHRSQAITAIGLPYSWKKFLRTPIGGEGESRL